MAELMKERGVTYGYGYGYTYTSDMQHKLPALIFSIQQEVDTLKAEKQANSKK